MPRPPWARSVTSRSSSSPRRARPAAGVAVGAVGTPIHWQPVGIDVSSYREEAEEFTAEISREHYLHLAGLKRELDLEPIYERHRRLFELQVVRSEEHTSELQSHVNLVCRLL